MHACSKQFLWPIHPNKQLQQKPVKQIGTRYPSIKWHIQHVHGRGEKK